LSGTAKAFVVINLIAAILFVGATAAYLAQRERERQEFTDLQKKYQDLQSSSQATEARLKEDNNVLNDKLAAETDAKARLETNLSNLTASLEMERKNRLEQEVKLTQLDNTLSGLQNDLSRALAAVDDQRKELVALRTTTEEAVEAKEAAIEEARAAQANAAAAIAQWRSTAKKLKEVEEALGRYEARYPEPGGVVAPAHLYGKVMQVNSEYNRVVVSLGEDDGVKKGMEFTVYRAAPEGGYVTTIVIEDVDKELSVARAATSLQGRLGEVRVGDNVSAAF